MIEVDGSMMGWHGRPNLIARMNVSPTPMVRSLSLSLSLSPGFRLRIWNQKEDLYRIDHENEDLYRTSLSLRLSRCPSLRLRVCQ